MAYLVHQRSGRRHALTAATLVGRSPTSDLCLPSKDVSRFHALIYWSEDPRGGAWRVRDLNSANGTFVGGPSSAGHGEMERIAPGRDTPLEAQTRIAFGLREDMWTLGEAEPPPIVLISRHADHEVRMTGRVLLLPPGAAPEAMVYRRGGEWALETEGDIRDLTANDRFTISGVEWRALAPGPSAATHQVADAVQLRLSVSADEDYVELSALRGGRRTRITGGTGNALYFLLTLARRRLKDATDGIPRAEQGWVHSSEIARLHRCSEATLNQWVFRLRARVAAAGFEDVQIVQRRPRTGNVRFGHLETVLSEP